MDALGCTEWNGVVLKGSQSWQNRQRTYKKKVQTEREQQGCKTKWYDVEIEVMGVRWWIDEELHEWGANTVWYRDKRSGMCAGRRLPYLNLGSQHLKVPAVDCVSVLLSSGHHTAWRMLNIFVYGSVENRKYTAATCVSTVIFVKSSNLFSQHYF